MSSKFVFSLRKDLEPRILCPIKVVLSTTTFKSVVDLYYISRPPPGLALTCVWDSSALARLSSCFPESAHSNSDQIKIGSFGYLSFLGQGGSFRITFNKYSWVLVSNYPSLFNVQVQSHISPDVIFVASSAWYSMKMAMSLCHVSCLNISLTLMDSNYFCLKNFIFLREA